MSSTNRSKLRYEHEKDYYITPLWIIREFFRAWNRQTSELQRLFLKDDALILDPCAGGDPSGNPMAYPTILGEWGLTDNVLTSDLRTDSPCLLPGTNFLTTDFGHQFDMVITNPPYNIAQEVVDRSLEVVKPGGWVIMLLRLNFLGSQVRGPWYETTMPHSTYTHSRRPSFYPENWREVMPWVKKKGSDSCEYAHFIWQKVSVSSGPYQGYVIPHVRGVSDAPGPVVKYGDANVID